MYIDDTALVFERHSMPQYAGYWYGAWTGGQEARDMLRFEAPAWRCVVDDFGSLVRVA